MIRLTDFPDDILDDIFHAMRDLMRFPGEDPVIQDTISYEQEDAAEHVVPLWANVIALSHVCRHWRDIMLYRPHLWTFIRVTGSFANRIMVNEMIARSGGFPLSILLTGRDHDPGHNRALHDLLGVTSVICDHSERIRELGVILSLSHADLILDSISKCRVPRLEKLWLDTKGFAPEGYAASPIPLFDTMVPPLRVLHIGHIPIPWLPYEDLVQLELMCGTSPPLPALLDALRSSPLLQILTLHISAPRSEDDDNAAIDGKPNIELPCLRRLRLKVDPVFNAAFSVLPRITFPPSTAVMLSFTGRIATSLYEDCQSLAAIACNVEHATFALGDACAYLLSTDQPLGIKYEVADTDLDEPGLPRFPPMARLYEGFLAVPLPALSTLSLCIYVNPEGPLGATLTHERFTRLFQATPSLRRLAVQAHPDQCTHVFKALATVVKDEQEHEDVLCPELQELAVTWQEEPSVDDFWNLERCCHFRASKGRGLARLETAPFPLIVRASLERSVPWVVEVVGS